MIDQSVIKTVRELKDAYDISCEDAGCFLLDKKHGVIPRPGDIVRLHLVNGSLIRGMDLNGHNVFYKSDEQLEAERLEWLANHEREKLADFEKNKPKLDADYAALPPVFQRRIDRFRKESKFRVDSEAYEMFCCVEAVKIANALGTPEKVKEFCDTDWDAQKRMVPDLSSDHSGNTFGGACALAHAFLEGKAL